MSDDRDNIYAEEPPPRFKEVGELNVAELIAWRRTGKRPETPAYVEHRAAVLAAHGLAGADDRPEPDLEAMTPEDHARRKFPASN